ncbi:MAG: hypothetical protein ACKOZW_03540, partial [Cyanobium sp.]
AMQRCLRGTGSSVRLLVARLRNAETLSRLAAEGLETFTISPAVAGELFASPATEAAAAQFERDAQMVGAGGEAGRAIRRFRRR